MGNHRFVFLLSFPQLLVFGSLLAFPKQPSTSLVYVADTVIPSFMSCSTSSRFPREGQLLNHLVRTFSQSSLGVETASYLANVPSIVICPREQRQIPQSTSAERLSSEVSFQTSESTEFLFYFRSHFPNKFIFVTTGDKSTRGLNVNVSTHPGADRLQADTLLSRLSVWRLINSIRRLGSKPSEVASHVIFVVTLFLA